MMINTEVEMIMKMTKMWASQDSLTPSAGLLRIVVSSRLRSVMMMMMVVVGMLVMVVGEMLVMMVISHPWKLMMTA